MRSFETVTTHILNTQPNSHQPSSDESVDRMLRFAPNFDLRNPTVPAPEPADAKLVTFFSRNLILGSLVTITVFTSQALVSCGN